MSFIVDKQTLNDLGIFSHKKEISVYGLFNNARTRGGAQILEEMFYNPLDNYELIRRRAALISYFQENSIEFPFKAIWFDAAEFYLSDTDERTRIVASEGDKADGAALQRKLRKLIKTDTEFEQAESGMVSLINIITTLDGFTRRMLEDDEIKSVTVTLFKIREMIESPAFASVLAAQGVEHLTLEQAAHFDNLLRYDNHEKVRQMLDYIYHLDVYMSVAKVASERGFVRAEVLPSESNVMELEQAFHPMLKKPVANDLTITAENNIVFLTGANMAGKSTFMKTFGICVFLAHVGFPVPAKSMRFSVRDGLFTTINLPDNLNQGFSHFYAEVRRLKRCAQSVNKCLREALPELLNTFDVVHICGKGNLDASLNSTAGYTQLEFVSAELADVFAACDLVLSRAGSNALMEFQALARPLLLVPYPKGASRGDQILNAQSLEKRGLCRVLLQENMTAETLTEAVKAAPPADGTFRVLEMIEEVQK